MVGKGVTVLEVEKWEDEGRRGERRVDDIQYSILETRTNQVHRIRTTS